MVEIISSFLSSSIFHSIQLIMNFFLCVIPSTNIATNSNASKLKNSDKCQRLKYPKVGHYAIYFCASLLIDSIHINK